MGRQRPSGTGAGPGHLEGHSFLLEAQIDDMNIYIYIYMSNAFGMRDHCMPCGSLLYKSLFESSASPLAMCHVLLVGPWCHGSGPMSHRKR